MQCIGNTRVIDLNFEEKKRVSKVSILLPSCPAELICLKGGRKETTCEHIFEISL